MKKKFLFALSVLLSVFVMTANSAITVRMYNTASWAKVGLWAWTDSGNLFSSWPGQELTKDADGMYSYTFADEVKNVNIIFNDFGGGVQTNDIGNITESTCFDVFGAGGDYKVIDCPSTTSSGSEYEFVKVTSASGLAKGEYLIVFEGTSVAFNGALTTLDAGRNNIPVTIESGVIESNASTDAAVFSINPADSTIKSASGYYIGITSYGNGLKQSETVSAAYKNAVSIDESGNAVITVSTSGGIMTLRYNSGTGDTNERFRYYKTGQKAIQLYKKVEKATPAPAGDTYTVAGVAELTGSTWDVTDTLNDMAVSEGVATKVYEGLKLAKGVYEFKIVVNHSWDENYPASNYVLTVPENGEYEVTITFDISSKEVGAKAVKTGEYAPPADVYIVAGDIALLGYDWDPTAVANTMTVTDDTAVLVLDSVVLERGEYWYKITKNGGRNAADWIPQDEGGEPRNLILRILEKAAYKVTFTYVIGATTAEAVAVKLGAETPVVQDYYIKHPWGTGKDEDWSWVKMEAQDSETHFTVGQWGGIGANINTAPDDAGAKWFAVADIDGSGYAELGDTVQFRYSVPDTMLSVKVIAKWQPQDTTQTDAVYSVVGNCVNGDNWDINTTANDMQLVDGIYTLVVPNVNIEAGFTISYKIVMNHSWDEEVYPNFSDNGNATYYVAEAAVYTVTYLYNVAADSAEVRLVKTGAPIPVRHVYSIVGDFLPWQWDINAALEMTRQDDSVYTYLLESVRIAEAGTYKYKLTADHVWGVYELPASGDNEYYFDKSGEYRVLFTANIAAHTLGMEATLIGDTTVVTKKYYLVGNMTGWEVKEEFVITDGKIVFPDVPAGQWEVKITDGQWGAGHEFNTLDTACTSEGVYVNPASGNIVVKTPVQQDITIIFDGTLVCIQAIIGEPPVKYYVAGDEGLTGKNWWTNYEDAALKEDGHKTFRNVPAGDHAFKITDGKWESEGGHEFTALDTVCSSKGVTGGYGQNISFTTYEVQDITISMDKDFMICVIVDTERPEGVTDKYVIAGDADLLGVDWNGTAEQNQMMVTDTMAILVKDSLYLMQKTYGFKVVKNGGMWIPDGMDNNSLLDIPAEGLYTVVFTYVLGAERAYAEAYRLDTAVIVNPDEYYIKHPWGTGKDEDWTWVKMEHYDMSSVSPYLWYAEGLWGGIGADLNTQPVDDSTKVWFPAEKILGAEEAVLGDTVRFIFNSADITLSVRVIGNTPVQTKKYYVAGTTDLLQNGDWAPDRHEFVDGVVVIKNSPAGVHGFKVTDGAWGDGHEYTDLDTACTSKGVEGGYGRDITFTTFKEQDITIYFDEVTRLICVTVDTERPQEFVDYYVIAGQPELMGVNWDANAEENMMTLVGDTAVLVKDSLQLAIGTYRFKVVMNGGKWIPEGTGNDSELKIEAAGLYSVVFTYILGAERATAFAIPIDVPVVESVYTVAGTPAELFGEEWNPALTANDMSLIVQDSMSFYVLPKYNVQLHAGKIEWKVAVNHGWEVSYGDYMNNNQNNVLSVPADGAYNVVFAFMPLGGGVGICQAEIMPVDTTVTSIYYLAGNKELTGYDWAPDSLAITQGAIVLENVPAGKHEFKITDGQWNTETDKTHEFTTLNPTCTSKGVYGGNGENIYFTTNKVQNVVIAIDDATKMICVVVDAVVPDTTAKKYYVAGTTNLLQNGDWAPDRHEFVDGVVVIKNSPAGVHGFKVTDGAWGDGHEFTALDTTCSSKGVTGGYGQNITFETFKEQDITIRFDAETKLICVTVDTEKPQEFVDYYIIAGDEKLLGKNWDCNAEENKMTVADGVATLVKESIDLAQGTYEFKVVKNGGLWIPDGMGNNSKLEIAETNTYKVTFTYVIGEDAASAVAEIINTAVDDIKVELDLNAPMYNVLGQQVGENYRGIVIQNGHKFLLW